MKIIKDDLRFILFSEIYLRFDEPKSRRKALNLLEAAIECLARKGFDQVTTEMIAREAGVSRSLVGYYFKNVIEIQDYALKYIRILYQRLAVDALNEKSTPKDMLLNYVKASLLWTQNMRAHAILWLSFLQRCGRDGKRRELNTAAVGAGSARIEALLKLGAEQGEFKCKDVASASRSIQVVVTGAVFSMCSENIVNEKSFIGLIQDTCLAIAVEPR